MIHRPVEEKDIVSICSLPLNEDELFFLAPKSEFPMTPAQLRKTIALRSDSTVIEQNGDIIAFANFYIWEPGGRCAIGNVIVSSAVRGKGVGRYLIEQMIDIAFSKHKASEVVVSCFNQNTAGLLFYPKLGFQPFAIEERLDKKERRVALIHLKLLKDASKPPTQSGD